MLLRQVGAVRELDLAEPRLEPREPGTERLHEALPREARTHALGPARILRDEGAHVVQTTSSSASWYHQCSRSHHVS